MDDWAPAPRASSCRVPTRARHGPHVQWQSPWSPDHRDALRSRRASASISRDASCQSRTSAQALTMDYAGHVPDRKSSLKHWSFASITPTTELSDHSSILAVRPRSIHTADTSIDLPPLVDPANLSEVKESPSSSSSNGVLASSSFLTALENVESSTTVASRPDAPDALNKEHPAEEQGNSVGATGEGNGTEPESSDVDSFAEQLRRRQRLEDESTLFKQGGYVDLGSDLPGLFETAARSPCLMCSLLEVAAIGSAPEDEKTETRAPKAPCKHKGLNTRRERLRALGYEYDTEESESGPERVTRGRTRNPTERTPIGRHQRESWGTIEEEPEEELGSQKVVPKLRREPRDLSKDMERLGRNRDFAAVPEDSEEGHAADVE